MPLRNDLLNPIPGDNPSGANLRYDPVTDKIKEARREDLDVPQGQWKTALKTADFPLVIKLGGDVLANRSKDLQIAVWLVDAHVRREGFVILAPALQFLRDLLEQYWDTLYPPVDEDGDMEVRAAPLEWLGTTFGDSRRPEFVGFLPIVSGKLSWVKYQESRTVGYEAAADNYEKQQVRESRMSEGKLSSEQFDEAADATPVTALKETYKQINAAKEALESLSELCDSQFGDFTPSFIKTRDALEEISQTVRIILGRKPGGLDEPVVEEPVEETVEEIVEETPSTEDSFSADDSASGEESFSMDSGTDSGDSDGDTASDSSGGGESFGEPTSREDVARQLVSICRFLRSQDPGDPTPYLMLRSFAWGGLMNKAPSMDHSIIEAPPSELRVNLKRLAKESQWDQLLETTEAAMVEPYGRTWLDLQRYTEAGLSGINRSGAATIVNKQLRLLLEVLPDVLTLDLPDDTPAANAETRNWIDNFVIVRRPGPLPPPPSTESTEETPSDSFSMDETPPEETPSDETPSDTDSSFSFDATPEPEAEATPEPEPEPAPEPEPEPYVVEESPPILEAEEPPPSDTSDEFGMALAAVRDGRTGEGLAMITSILATERSGRARFRRRTQLAHLLMAAGKGKVAQPLLDQLAAEIEERRLEDWEPSEAIAYPLELLLHCLSPADDERRTQLFLRICKLDPVRAVTCSY
jgi:type VI secretion system protein ImpA